MSTSRADMRVGDILLPLDRIPLVKPTTLLKTTLETMARFRLGIAAIVDDADILLGIFTDGDIRRMLLRDQKPFPALFADDIIRHATRNPTVIGPDENLARAIEVMEEKEIWDLPVVDKDGHLQGLLHLHPAIKAVLAL
jgi:arabinose-5-phosphate isomerase